MLHYRVCHLCEAMCGLEIEHDGEKVLSVRGDKQDPFSQGFICPKGARIAELHEDPSRLKTPLLKQKDGSWKEIGWKEALDLAGSRLNGIRQEHGLDAVGLYIGNPTVHNYGFLTYVGDLRRALKSRNVYSATSMDQLPHQFMAHEMFGHTLHLAVPDIDRTDYLLIMGANPAVSNGSLMSAGGVKPRLDAIRARNGRVVVLDPRRTETTKQADAHHFIRPATDAYFLLALLQQVFENDWVNHGHLGAFLTGEAALRELVNGFPPEEVADICGMSAGTIREIAKDYATTERAVIYGRMGLSSQAHGTLCNWLILVLNLLTGHLDREGGAMFSTPAVDLVRRKKYKKTYGRYHSRVRGLPESEGELPIVALAEEIMTPGEGQIRAMITHAGNPVLSSPNGKQLEEAFSSLDFLVCIDVFLNETTRHADLILPPAAFLEVDHYDFVFNHLAVRNNAKFSAALFAPKKGQWYDWQIAKTLIKDLAPIAKYPLRRMFHWGTPRRLLNLGLLTGPYGKFRKLSNLFSGLSLAKLKANPHGISLGPLKPRLDQILQTPDRKIRLLPDWAPVIVKNLMDKITSPSTPLADNEFYLVGRRHLRSNNSWMHNAPGLAKGKKRCTLQIHPTDAARLGISNHQEVKVVSRTGAIQLPVEVGDEMMPGVISIPHGFGHHRKGTDLPVAEASPGVSVNDITDELLVDPVSGNAAFSGQRVHLELPVLA